MHELAEQRSLELHRVIASALTRNPALRDRAKDRLDRWTRSGALAPEHAAAWSTLLDGPLEVLLAALTDESEDGRALRQTTPFTFVVGPRERWRMWREARARWEGRA